MLTYICMCDTAQQSARLLLQCSSSSTMFCSFCLVSPQRPNNGNVKCRQEAAAPPPPATPPPPPPFGPPVRSFHWSLIEFRFVSIRFDSLGCVRTPQSRFVRISICPASSPDGDSLWRYVLFFFLAFCWIDMLAMFVDQPGANCPHQLLIAAVRACVRYPVSVSVSVDICICVCKWLAT